MKRLLFVDDEPRLLEGLRRLLHPMGGEWGMTFVGSGHEALELLEKGGFDLIITDMRMPGMDGAQLLGEVRKRHPGVIRIVLSGQSDQETIIRALGQTHQFLSKPCNPDELKETVARACALRELLASEAIRSLITGMESVPSLPTMYNALLAQIESPRSSMEQIAAIISKDIGMTTKVLQLVNSAFFGLRTTVVNPAQAVGMLGLDLVKSLVLGVHVFSQFRPSERLPFSIETVWKSGLATAKLAQAIARAENASLTIADTSFTAGLLHDLGILLLAANFSPRFNEAFALSAKEHIALPEAERQIFGASHAEVGAYLLGLWGIGEHIVEAVGYHHTPGRCVGRTFSPLTAVHVANALVQEDDPAACVGGLANPVDTDYVATLGLTDRLPCWRELFHGMIHPEVHR